MCINRKHIGFGIVSVCPSVDVENSSIDFDKIWYERYATVGHPKPIIFNFQLEIQNGRTRGILERERRSHHWIYGYKITYERSLINMELLLR
jgi:hypothetical protein